MKPKKVNSKWVRCPSDSKPKTRRKLKTKQKNAHNFETKARRALILKFPSGANIPCKLFKPDPMVQFSSLYDHPL